MKQAEIVSYVSLIEKLYEDMEQVMLFGKKILVGIVSILMLSLVACDSSESTKRSREISILPDSPVGSVSTWTDTLDGHSYRFFSGFIKFGATHDPDCLIKDLKDGKTRD